jgi:hypothetical protein
MMLRLGVRPAQVKGARQRLVRIGDEPERRDPGDLRRAGLGKKQ